MRMPVLGAAAALGVVVHLGCDADSAEVDVTQAQGVIQAIRSLREAPNERKASQLEALKLRPCTGAPVCALKTRCIESYAAHVAAYAKIQEVKIAMQQGQASTDLATRLNQAERALETAAEQTRDCAKLESQVRSDLRL